MNKIQTDLLEQIIKNQKILDVMDAFELELVTDLVEEAELDRSPLCCEEPLTFYSSGATNGYFLLYLLGYLLSAETLVVNKGE